jgi:hypothetical protein
MPLPIHCIDCDKPIAGGARQCPDCKNKEKEMLITMADATEYKSEENSIAEIVRKMEEDYPETTQTFKKIQREQYELFCRKQHDYGPKNVSVGTELRNETEIRVALTGLWFRMNDKIQRAKNMLLGEREAAVKDEPLEDAFLDLANYGIMASIVKRDKWGK